MHPFKALKKFFRRGYVKQPHFLADRLGVYDHNVEFLTDEPFASAWKEVEEYNQPYWPRGTPDIRWRAHICIWAARHGLTLAGDFVECGVNTGILSSMICRTLEFDRPFYLFDTFHGIPGDHPANKSLYNFDAYPVAQKAFRHYPNVTLVRGILPGSLADAKIDRIAYLSIDLNVAAPEIATIQKLWDRLSPSATVVLDDYGWKGCEEQYRAWNKFARQKNATIVTLPTGQGLIIKP